MMAGVFQLYLKLNFARRVARFDLRLNCFKLFPRFSEVVCD